MHFYGLTYVKNTDPNFIDSYYDLLASHQKKFPKIQFDMCFEYKPETNRLHSHLLLEVQEKDHSRVLRQYPFQKEGWSIRLDYLVSPLDLLQWQKYYKKNSKAQTDLINYEYEILNIYKKDVEDRRGDIEQPKGVEVPQGSGPYTDDGTPKILYNYLRFDIRKFKSVPILLEHHAVEASAPLRGSSL